MSLRAYTAPELVLLRSDRQFVKPYLTVFKPATIYSARVNGVPASDDKVASIEYDGGSGTLANLKPGMTIRFGAVAGARDIGEERVRKAPDADTFFFGETSDIDWVDDAYITVVDDFQLRAKHIRISGGAALVDYDVTYSNQHTAFDPVPVMGSNRIAWLTGATVAITVPQLANSWVLGSTISSYSTTCAGATVTNGTTSNPAITFSSPGRYVIYSTVTAANGKSFTGVRYVYVHDGTDMPYSDFELLDLSGNYDDGGFSARIRLFTDAADVSTFEEGALCILHCLDYYDGEEQTIEMEIGTGNILFVGRIANENIVINKEQATVDFDLEGFQERGKKTDEAVNLSGVVVDESGRGNALFSMSKGHVSQNYFPYGVELAKNTPSTWTQIPSLTAKRALFDLLHWYSTATAIMDVYIEDDARLASELSAAGETLWEKITELAYLSIFASPGVDPYGRLWIEIEPQLVPEADRDAVEVMEIRQADWTGQIDIARMPTQRGSPEIIDRLLLSTQAQSNQLAGLYYGWKHNEFGPIGIDFASILRGFTLFPRQIAYIEIAAADNVRGIVRNLNIIPREVTYRHNAQAGTLLPSISFEAETFEAISILGDVPGSEDDDISIPPLPPLPPLPPIPPVYPSDPTASPDGPSVVLLVDDAKGILYTAKFNVSNSDLVYQFWNIGIAATDIPLISTGNRVAMFVTPNGAVYVGIRTDVVGALQRWIDKIYYASAIGGTFTKIIDQAWFDANSGLAAGYAEILGVGYNPNKSEEVAFILGTSGDDNKNFWIGNAAGWTKKVAFSQGTNVTGGLTFGGGKWVWDVNFTNAEFIRRYNADGSSVEQTQGDFGQLLAAWHVRAGTGPVIVKSFGAGGMLRTIDNIANVSNVAPTDDFGINIAIAPDGSYMLANWDTGLRGKSPDGGTSWSGLPNLPVGGEYCFAYAGGTGVNSRWIAARGVIRYSDNAFGAESWVNKEGNINYLIPTGLSIQKIIVPGFANGN